MNGHDQGEARGRRLAATVVLNAAITVAQVIGGLWSGSLSLLSDAMHNLSDVIALSISWIANRLSSSDSTPERTFGLRGAEVMAALINSSALFVVSIFLAMEGIKRLMDPVPVASGIVIVLAAMGLAVNGFSALVLKPVVKGSLNVRSAYLHVLTDALASIAVLVGGVAMLAWDAYWVDGAITLAISVAIVYSSIRLLWDTVRVLMHFTPKGLDMDEVVDRITMVPGVLGMHHVHVWMLDEDQIHFEAHVVMDCDMTLSEVQESLVNVEKLLLEYDIGHVILQPEVGPICDVQKVFGP